MHRTWIWVRLLPINQRSLKKCLYLTLVCRIFKKSWWISLQRTIEFILTGRGIFYVRFLKGCPVSKQLFKEDLERLSLGDPLFVIWGYKYWLVDFVYFYINVMIPTYIWNFYLVDTKAYYVISFIIPMLYIPFLVVFCSSCDSSLERCMSYQFMY